MGTRRASSSPARTELVKAVRTRETAAAARGVAILAARRFAKRSASPPAAGAGRSAGSRSATTVARPARPPTGTVVTSYR